MYLLDKALIALGSIDSHRNRDIDICSKFIIKAYIYVSTLPGINVTIQFLKITCKTHKDIFMNEKFIRQNFLLFH